MSSDRTEPQAGIEAWFERATAPSTLALIVAVAGACLIAGPWLEPAHPRPADWWSVGAGGADFFRLCAALTALAIPLALGAAWRAWIERPRRFERASLVGALLMGTAALWALASWGSARQRTPIALATLAPGEPIEVARAWVDGAPVRVMLARRVRLISARERPEPRITLEFSRPKAEPSAPIELGLGESVEVADTRLTFIGVRESAAHPRVRVRGPEGTSIEGVAGLGDALALRPEGPRWTVKNVTTNYLGALGPAVQLEPDQGGEARWIFADASARERAALGGDLELVGLESAPLPVLAVAPSLGYDWALSATLLFSLGLAIYLIANAELGARRREA